jgi:hypothetical protein
MEQLSCCGKRTRGGDHGGDRRGKFFRRRLGCSNLPDCHGNARKRSVSQYVRASRGVTAGIWSVASISRFLHTNICLELKYGRKTKSIIAPSPIAVSTPSPAPVTTPSATSRTPSSVKSPNGLIPPPSAGAESAASSDGEPFTPSTPSDTPRTPSKSVSHRNLIPYRNVIIIPYICSPRKKARNGGSYYYMVPPFDILNNTYHRTHRVYSN